MAAVISLAFFKAIKAKKEFTAQEANICQTVAAAAGAMSSTAGLVAGIPGQSVIIQSACCRDGGVY